MDALPQQTTYYPNGHTHYDFKQQPGQTGQAGAYRCYDEQGRLRETQLKSANGHVWLECRFGTDGSQSASLTPPGGGGWTTQYGQQTKGDGGATKVPPKQTT
jgi:hypothetical protein